MKMGAFEILLLAGFVFLFLLVIDHGSVTLKALRNRWLPSKSRTAKVLPFASSSLGFKKPFENPGIESSK
jgi:hypothetical protein